MVEHGSLARYAELETNHPEAVPAGAACERRAGTLPRWEAALFSTIAGRHVP